MRNPKLITNYSFLREEAVSPLAHRVVKQTTESAFIDHGVDRAAAVLVAVTALDAAVEAHPEPTTAQTAAITKLRTAVRYEMGVLAKKLNLDYPTDDAALLSSGLTLAEPPSGLKPIVTPPTNVVLLDAPQAGCLLVRFKRPTGAVVILIRYTTDRNLPEDQWLVAVGGGRERQLGPFAPGTKVWVKVAGLSASTMEPDYSAVGYRIVQ